MTPARYRFLREFVQPWVERWFAEMLDAIEALMEENARLRAERDEAMTWRADQERRGDRLLRDLLVELGEPGDPCPSSDALDELRGLKRRPDSRELHARVMGEDDPPNIERGRE